MTADKTNADSNSIGMKELCCLFCCPPLPSRIAAKLAFLPPEPTYDFVPIAEQKISSEKNKSQNSVKSPHQRIIETSKAHGIESLTRPIIGKATSLTSRLMSKTVERGFSIPTSNASAIVVKNEPCEDKTLSSSPEKELCCPYYNLYLGLQADWHFSAKDLDRLEAFTVTNKRGTVLPCIMVRSGVILSSKHTENPDNHYSHFKAVNSADIPFINIQNTALASVLSKTLKGGMESGSHLYKQEQYFNAVQSNIAVNGTEKSTDNPNSSDVLEEEAFSKSRVLQTIRIDTSKYGYTYKPNKYVILFSHGNAVDIGQMSTFFLGLGQKLGCDVIGYDYSGYGRSYTLSSPTLFPSGLLYCGSTFTNCPIMFPSYYRKSGQINLSPTNVSKKHEKLLNQNRSSTAEIENNVINGTYTKNDECHDYLTNELTSTNAKNMMGNKKKTNSKHPPTNLPPSPSNKGDKWWAKGRKRVRPSEASLYQDIEAVWNGILERYNLTPDRVILYGQSIGTVPTIHLAAHLSKVYRENLAGKNNSNSKDNAKSCGLPAGIILHSPLLSGLRVAFPFLVTQSQQPTPPQSGGKNNDAKKKTSLDSMTSTHHSSLKKNNSPTSANKNQSPIFSPTNKRGAGLPEHALQEDDSKIETMEKLKIDKANAENSEFLDKDNKSSIPSNNSNNSNPKKQHNRSFSLKNLVFSHNNHNMSEADKGTEDTISAKNKKTLDSTGNENTNTQFPSKNSNFNNNKSSKKCTNKNLSSTLPTTTNSPLIGVESPIEPTKIVNSHTGELPGWAKSIDAFYTGDKATQIDPSIPTFVIHGMSDEVVDFSHGQTIHALIKGSVVPPLFIPGAGHNDIEIRGEYIQRLRKFLREDIRI